MRSPAAPIARRCWSGWNGPACSWCRWMRCAAGGATTTCSPTCSAPACSSNGPAGFGRCTGPRPPGVRSMASPTTRCATPWPPGTPPGRRGWSSGTPTRFSCAAKARPCSGGLRRCPPGWPARGRGCCWPRRAWLSSATAWRRPRSRWMPPSARWQALRAWPMSRSSLLSAGPRATWPTCPRRSRSGAPSSPCSMATPNARSHSAAGPWPRSARASGCWHPTPTGTWAWPSGCAAGLQRPSARCRRASPRGGRPASPP